MDLRDLIDITRPYLALINVHKHSVADDKWQKEQVKPIKADDLSAFEIEAMFHREQPNVNQLTPFCASEISRNLVATGSLACADLNSVKEIQFYLMTEADLYITGIQDAACTTLTAFARVELSKTDFQRKRAAAFVRAMTDDGRLYAYIRCVYRVVTEREFLKAVPAPDPYYLSGAQWQRGEPSPYINPVSLRLIRVSKEKHQGTAVLPLLDARKMAGHFTARPSAAVSILGSNAMMLVGEVVRAKGVQFWVSRAVVNTYRLVQVGEVLRLNSVLQPNGTDAQETHVVTFVDEKDGVTTRMALTIEKGFSRTLKL